MFLLAGILALLSAWLLPRLQQPLTPHAVAVDLIEAGRGAEAVHLLSDRTWRGVAEYRALRFRRATAEFVQVEDATALYNLGTAYARLAEWSAARAAYGRALALAPDHADAQFNLALVLKAEARQQEEADAERQSRTLGSEDSTQQTNDETGPSDAETKDDDTAQPSDDVAPTDKTANRAGQISAAGRAGDEAQLPEQLGGRGALGDADDQTAADQTGAAATLIRRQSAQNAEMMLRAIRDDPARVLRARLYAIHKQRQEAGQ